MENRPPPRHKSPGRSFDRSRSKGPFRPTGAGGGQNRSSRPPGNSVDGRDRDRGPSRGRPPRREGDQSRNLDQRSGDNRGRYGSNVGGNRREGQGAKRTQVEPEIRIVSDWQITDGKFRGKSLVKSVLPGAVPTQRKLREVAFKIMARRVKAGRILDLGAAGGTIGIEAISRGAMLVTFVERSARMCTLIRKNLAEFEIKPGHGEVVEMEALPFLIRTARRRRTWDIVYLDVPHGDAHAELLDYISRGTPLKASGLLVIHYPSTISFPEKINRLRRWRTADHGETILTIYERM